MNKKILAIGLSSAMSWLAGGAALAGSEPGSWYVAPEIQGLWLDDERVADDDIGFQLALGKALNQNWDIEGFLARSSHATTGEDLDFNSLGIAVHRVFYRESRAHPYLSVGLTYLEGDQDAFGNDEVLTVTYGLGVLADLAKNAEAGTNFQLRAELLGRRATSGQFGSRSDPVDYVAGLGLQYSWGAAPVAAGPPPAPEAPADSDGDGVIDANDKCPGTPPGTPVNADGCEFDGDGDGVVDRNDKCPNTPPGTRVDAVGCELDTDGDGVVDSKDKCPDTPKGDRVDIDGCSIKEEIRLPGVVFETNSAELRPESFPILETAVATLKKNPDLRIEVAGHTDSQGSDAYNLALSERRAATVMRYLQDAGVANALTSRGYGERSPIADNTSEEGRLRNRRVVLRVLN
jgi:OOP family OmpA-OmpF porin